MKKNKNIGKMLGKIMVINVASVQRDEKREWFNTSMSGVSN